MILSPVSSREAAERMAAANIAGTLQQAVQRGYRVVEVEIRELAAQ